MTFELYAIRYAHREGHRAEHFYGSIDRPDEPMPLSYYVWLAVQDDRAVLIDTGFTAETAARRGRTYVVSPAEGVQALGIAPEAIDTVILTHLHYDHAGCTPMFDRAQFVLQEAEMAFWTGRHAARIGLPHLVDPDDITTVCQANFANRVSWADGHLRVAPGIEVHRVGGHTTGMQIVTVATAEGTVVVASDAGHFYENIETDRPYAVLDSVPDAHAAFDHMRELAGGSKNIIPGHDPAVMEKYPAAQPHLAGLVARIA
ncbi:MAG: N-acyl homoserine lactonase family protein [Acidimicrobiales bacterium]|nr:N-acyl homoserine lactonase family protein [Acidimicrobiales bacterium]